MVESTMCSGEALLAEVAEDVAATLAQRGQSLQLDADPSIRLDADERDRAALVDLVRFAARTAPSECELLIAAARRPGRVTAVGQGEVVLRWQLALDGASGPAAGEGVVVPLRAAPDSAESVLGSLEPRALIAAFGELRRGLSFEILGAGRELRARVAFVGR